MALQFGGVVGTGISSPSALLVNTLDSISQKHIAPFLSDIVNKPSPTHWALQQAHHRGGTDLPLADSRGADWRGVLGRSAFEHFGD